MKLVIFYQASAGFRTAIGRIPGAVSSHASRSVSALEACWASDAPRRSLFAPVLLGAGIGVYFALPQEPPALLIAAPLPLFVVWRAVVRFGAVQTATLMAAGSLVAAGFALSVARARILDTPSIMSETPELTITGRVRDTEPNARGGTRITLELDGIDDWDGPVPRLIRLSTAGQAIGLNPGVWIRARTRLRPLPSPVAPGGFDFGRKLWFDGIRAQAFTIRPVEPIPTPRAQTLLETASTTVQQWRDSVSERIRSRMSERTGPLAVAFLTGERGGIQKADNQAMRDSSLAHLLSISGIHMILAGFGFFSALRLALSFVPACAGSPATRKWAAAAALVVSAGYLVLSGASVPTQRAFVTIAVSFLAIMTDRSALSLRTVALAATSILVVTPEAWMDPSFQMSFSAVAALVAFHEWWSTVSLRQAGTAGWAGWLMHTLVATAITSLVAGTATAPFAAFHFNRLSVYGVAANVLVTPVVSFMIMPAGVLALLMIPFGLDEIPLAVMQEGLEIMLRIAAWVATWPGAVIPLGSFPIDALVAMCAGGIWVVVWQARWRWLGALPLSAGLCMTFLDRAPDVIISETGHNVAIMSGRGTMKFLSARRDRFDAEMWLRASGDARDISSALRDTSGGFDCSSDPCLALTGNGHWIAVTQSASTPSGACTYADVLIAPALAQARPCRPGTLSVDQEMLEREGAISIWLEEGRARWTSVQRERGQRLWTPAAGKTE